MVPNKNRGSIHLGKIAIDNFHRSAATLNGPDAPDGMLGPAPPVKLVSARFHTAAQYHTQKQEVQPDIVAPERMVKAAHHYFFGRDITPRLIKGFSKLFNTRCDHCVSLTVSDDKGKPARIAGERAGRQ